MSGTWAVMELKGPVKVEGACTLAGHEKKIPVASFSHSCARNMADGSNDPVADLRNSRVHIGGVVITKNADQSTPLFAQCVCNGTVFEKVIIEALRNSEGSGDQVYYTVTLENAFVKSHDQSGHASAGGTVSTMETVVFGFSKIKWEYKVINEKGKVDGSVPASWDVTKSRA